MARATRFVKYASISKSFAGSAWEFPVALRKKAPMPEN